MYLFVVKECTGHGSVSKKDNIYIAYKHGVLENQYGGGVKAFHHICKNKFNLPYPFAESEQIYRKVNKEFPQFKSLQRAVTRLIDQQGYIVDDLGGLYYVPHVEKYKGVNYYCQGLATNLFKMWMLKVRGRLSNSDYLWLVVHDEIDAAIAKKGGKREALKRVKKYCDAAREIDVLSLPVIAEPSGLCDNWGET
jgi:DNA polymerase I-like protein with 3'-5' exonuclease and polymerase domains